MTTALISVEGLNHRFDVSPPLAARLIRRQPRRYLHAVQDVSFSVEPQRTLGLVGESGCGKSTLARCLAGLMAPTSGRILYQGRPLDLVNNPDPVARRAVQMVFQDPYASLNPRWTVGETVGDPLLSFGLVSSRAEMRTQVANLLSHVGLEAGDARRYPHEFSGGQRQRIAIARALSSRPAFLICDEPTSALDVSVQAHILNLMRDLQQEYGLTLLFISHNLAVVDHMADKVGVMYLGRLVELQAKHDLFSMPGHPYTRLLIEAAPSRKRFGRESAPLTGETPSPLAPPPGCAFHTRCPHTDPRCRTEVPNLLPLEKGGAVACHRIQEGGI